VPKPLGGSVQRVTSCKLRGWTFSFDTTVASSTNPACEAFGLIRAKMSCAVIRFAADHSSSVSSRIEARLPPDLVICAICAIESLPVITAPRYPMRSRAQDANQRAAYFVAEDSPPGPDETQRNIISAVLPRDLERVNAFGPLDDASAIGRICK
jgi:hypothetical protein